jgi:GNAT superfamily N-acetyltransferase
VAVDHPARVATRDDLEGVTETVWQAFLGDPIWRWVFGEDEEAPRHWWRFLIQSALRYRCVRVSGDFAAVAVWIPPGGVELTEEEEERVEPLMRELVGDRCAAVIELLGSFDASHPAGTPHYYLSLLATHPGSRGQGVGMRLLAESLGLIDAEGAPAYLESSNPANDRRYERLGFARCGAFSTPDGAHTVATMWRPPHPSSPVTA